MKAKNQKPPQEKKDHSMITIKGPYEPNQIWDILQTSMGKFNPEKYFPYKLPSNYIISDKLLNEYEKDLNEYIESYSNYISKNTKVDDKIDNMIVEK